MLENVRGLLDAAFDSVERFISVLFRCAFYLLALLGRETCNRLRILMQDYGVLPWQNPFSLLLRNYCDGRRRH